MKSSPLRRSLHRAEMPIKSAPEDIEQFHQETTVKYPTFQPQPVQAPIPYTPEIISKLAQHHMHIRNAWKTPNVYPTYQLNRLAPLHQ